MKQLLIIQQDEPYFLFEALQVLEENWGSLRDFQTTILVNKNSVEKLGGLLPILTGITTDEEVVKLKKYDISVNLSMTETSWTYHADINSLNKIGPYLVNGQLIVNDSWSSYLLTLKARAPFLTFHLQQIYQNILGIRAVKSPSPREATVNRIVFGSFNVDVFPGHEQEKLVQAINRTYPNCPIMDISEVDPISDLTQTLYIGPVSLEAVQICEFGARGFFLGSHFQGFNLLPAGDGHYFISSRGDKFSGPETERAILTLVQHAKAPTDTPYSVYVTDEENLFGGYLRSLNKSDDNYPIYQSHVVLWNFLLNLFDTNLEITTCSPSQMKLIQNNREVLNKLIRLYDYAMTSVDTIHSEAKSNQADFSKIQEQINHLKEVDLLTDQISQSHSFLRPILDFYRIRRGQNHGSTLLEQSQHSFLTYSEEHQALQALEELFSVTLQKNEVNI